MWSRRRASKTDVFDIGVPVANIRHAEHRQSPLYLTHDRCVRYFATVRPGGVSNSTSTRRIARGDRGTLAA
jgi:hypothetical protein